MTQKVYVSLTTISERVRSVHETITSILSQDYPVDKVTLYISKEPFIIDKGIQDVPVELLILTDADSRFTIEYVENIGPYRKLIPCLKDHWLEDCLIITVDDDKIYDHDMISNMVAQFKKTGEKYIVANRAFVKINRLLRQMCEEVCGVPHAVCQLISDEISNKGNAQTLSYLLSNQYDFIRIITFFEGNDGVLYHPKFFTPIVYDWELILKLAKTHDDFWFKMCALINGYGVTCVNPFKDRKSQQREYTKDSALHFNVNVGSYDKYLNGLVRWFHKNGLLHTGVNDVIKNK